MIPKSSTIQDAIHRAQRDLQDISNQPKSDAQLLLANILGRSRTWIMTHSDIELSPQQVRDFHIALHRYRSGEALPHILGWWEFYGRRFNLTQSVLIPRPETEHLIEQALKFLHTYPGKKTAMDIGTGSGCIAVTLLIEVRELEVIATDISHQALQVAKVNAARYGVQSRLHLAQMDLAVAVERKFDLICANLPYIPTATLEGLKVARSEPRIALNGGEDGLWHIRRLLEDLPRLLLPGGCAFLEMEAGTSKRVMDSARSMIAHADIHLIQDLAGYDRVLAIKWCKC